MPAALRVVAEIGLGLAALAALAACVLAWRLGQGPLDITWLLRRERALLSVPGATLHIGGATLAWGGFGARDQPLKIKLADVSIAAQGDGPRGHVESADIGLPIGGLLLGRVAPRAIEAKGVALNLTRRADGGLALGRTRNGGGLSWPAQLSHLRIEDGAVVLRDAALGVVWRADQAHASLDQTDEHVQGELRATLRAGGVASTLDVHVAPVGGLSRMSASLAPVNPGALALVSPHLAPLAALDAPVGVTGTADLDPSLAVRSGTLRIEVGPGTVSAGKGRVALAPSNATLSGTLAGLRLESLRLALAQAPGTSAPPPVFSGQATASRADGRVHATFAIDLPQASMADLGRYWPEGVGGGARPWLVRNVSAGHVHAAHVQGSLDAPEDLSDTKVGALSGGLLVDDATIWWLRPVPPLIHATGRVTVEGPDSLLVTLDRATQDRLVLAPGSIHITKLEEPHQFGDISANLSGPLADALALLNHPRLKLLSRGHVDVVDPAGDVRAQLSLNVPLEDRVTMDQIPISATATLAGVHLGGIVGGRDLNRAALALKVTGDGLDLDGHGEVAGIPAKLALDMDFRAGPPGQVVQHLTAEGSVTGAQLVKAGVPDTASSIITGGQAGLRVDYAGHRDGTADIRLDSDLARAALSTPLGWSKPAGPAATAGAHVRLDHGRLTGLDQLHADGPDLRITSRAEFVAGQRRALLLEQVKLGRTDLRGRVLFPDRPGDPIDLVLTGPVVDLSSYLAKPASPPDPPTPPDVAEDAPPGQPWSADLRFDRILLGPGRSAAPAALRAQSDGRHITRADATAGQPGDFSARIVPVAGGRHLEVRAGDAGDVLHALGMGDNLSGGSLTLDASYADSQPGSPLSGTATLEQFQVHQAASVGRLLQAMTLYGLVDVLRGPGLRFSKLVAPFRWHRRVLHLTSARAFSASLGITAHGDIDLRRHVADLRGTVVPAYFFNQLLGDLPVVGRVFSPEKGGGVFAARYSVRGPLANPTVGINPLAALTPGFLRDGFGLFAPAPPAQ